MILHPLPGLKHKNTSKRLMVNSCGMHEELMEHYSPISALASQQSKPTTETMKRVRQFLDYCATQEPAVLTYCKSDMVLSIHSDASYLNEEQACSRAGGIITCQKMCHSPQTMALFSTLPKLLKPSCPLQQKQSFEHCLLMQKRG